MHLMFIKDNSIVKIPNKSCSNKQLKINSEKFQNLIENNIDAFFYLKTDHFIQMNFYQIINNF